MIRYALACDAGHGFESWFRDAAAYDDGAARGLVTCPVCGSPRVAKAVMAPALGRRGAGEAPAEDAAPSLTGAEELARRAAARGLRAKILAETEDVGAGFADQALAMHRGESDHRAIRGEASPAEALRLAREGVAFGPLPPAPEDRD